MLGRLIAYLVGWAAAIVLFVWYFIGNFFLGGAPDILGYLFLWIPLGIWGLQNLPTAAISFVSMMGADVSSDSRYYDIWISMGQIHISETTWIFNAIGFVFKLMFACIIFIITLSLSIIILPIKMLIDKFCD
jgi:hypothetical protein